MKDMGLNKESDRFLQSPWVWIPCLTVADEIPGVIVTFIAVLMFVQLGFGPLMSTLFAALLFVPLVMKHFMRHLIKRISNIKWHIHVAECFLFVCLIWIAVYVERPDSSRFMLFLSLLLLSVLRAWHSSLAKVYYERMFVPRKQRIFSKTRSVASQTTIVLTYGVMIIIVGFLEIFFRDFSKAWAMGCYIMSGFFLFFLVMNVFSIRPPMSASREKLRITARKLLPDFKLFGLDHKQKYMTFVLFCMFLSLVPQALMFNTRVLFLLAPLELDGLNCSLQEVGFAQGTIGVLAFTFGLFVGRSLINRLGRKNMFMPMSIVLTLSPVSYMLMSWSPHSESIVLICLMTFFAQWCFGFGLNACGAYIKYVYNERYKDITNYLYTPLVSAMLILPMIVSGWLADAVGFKYFFVINSASALVAWIVMWVGDVKGKLFLKPVPIQKTSNVKVEEKVLYGK